MNSNLFTIFLCLYISIQSVFAQDVFTLKGVVNDQNKEPLPGVSVILKGTDTGGITDFDGRFTLQVKKGDVLVCSFIGMKTKEITVANQSNIAITLEDNVEQLDEVVVTGYGEMRKRDLTGSLTQIDETTEVKEQFQTVDALLQGRSTGVQVIGNDGNPGGATSVRIRGVNSLRGNNEPLYVVDGVIISTAGEGVADAFGGGGNTVQAQNGLTGLNPRDIETIEVLKDASATAIYGSRGANGVVLITTKKGKQGSDKISAYFNTSLMQVNRKIDVLDGTNYAKYINLANAAHGGASFGKYDIDEATGDVYALLPNNQRGEKYTQHNWQDELYRDSWSQNAGMNFSGGKGGSNYYISANFRNNNGTQPVAYSQGGDIRVNLSRKLNKKLKLDVRSSLYYNQGSFSQSGVTSGNGSLVTQGIMANPLTKEEGDQDNNELEFSNNRTPVERMNGTDDLAEELRINLLLGAKYDISKSLSYQFRAGTDIRMKNREVWYGTGTTRGDRMNNYYNQSAMDRKSFTIDNLLFYKKKFGANHKINATFGYTIDGVILSNQVYGVSNFFTGELKDDFPGYGQDVILPMQKTYGDYALMSGLSRINYTFKDRYILTASFRADASSKFRPGQRIGYFPSLSAAWYVSDEPFMDGVKGVLSNLKLRAGWGQTGNQSVGPYNTWENYQDNRYAGGVGMRPISFENEDLTWETTQQTNVGVDLGFLNDRVNVVVDAYYKETQDLLQLVQTPESSGFANYMDNLGNINSKGLEVALDVVAIDKESFKLQVGGNISFNRTYVGDLGVPEQEFYLNGELVSKQRIFGNSITSGYQLSGPSNVFIRGEQIALLYGYETNGVYQSHEAAAAGPKFQGENVNQGGDVIYVDQNGDGKIDEQDLTVIGNPNPEFTYGLNINASYKRLSLKMLFTGVYGNEILNSGLAFYGYPDPMWSNGNVYASVLEDNWHETDNPTGQNPRIGYGNRQSDDFVGGYNNYVNSRMVEDGSYLRLSTVTLSYDVPTSIFKNKIKYLNVYFTARNLLTITDYSGYDPEITSYLYDGTIQGVDWQTMPNPRTFIGGVNITF